MVVTACKLLSGHYGALAQLGERKVRNLEVRGSIPLCSTNSNELPFEISTFQRVFYCCSSFLILPDIGSVKNVGVVVTLIYFRALFFLKNDGF